MSNISNVKIFMNGEPLGAIQKWEEEYFTAKGLLNVTIKIDRVIFDDYSMLAYILNGGHVELEVHVGEQVTKYTALNLRAGSRDFNSETNLHMESLVLSSAYHDNDLDELKDYLGKLMHATKALKEETIIKATL